MSWLKKLIPSKIRTDKPKKAVPEGLWTKCPNCKSFLFKSDLERNLDVCPKCAHHLRIKARNRIDLFLDEDGREELATNVIPKDRLKFKDSKRYKDRISQAQKATGEKDALIAFAGRLESIPVTVCAFDFDFIGGSMGCAVGEKFFQAVTYALQHKTPFICFAASGGARMQESLLSLMQMAKTSACIQKLAEKRLPYISILVDPCMGGVTASLAMLGDLNIAEPNALIGFAGPRVIEQTVRETLPEGFQRAEFLLDKGVIDMVVDRRNLRDTVARQLSKFFHLQQ